MAVSEQERGDETSLQASPGGLLPAWLLCHRNATEHDAAVSGGRAPFRCLLRVFSVFRSYRPFFDGARVHAPGRGSTLPTAHMPEMMSTWMHRHLEPASVRDSDA